MVGRGGCECDGLVSNTLSLSLSVTSTHPSMVNHSAVCFKAIVLLPLQSVCWCCCVVPLFAPCLQSTLIDNCHLFVCTMSCVCVGFVCVCCMMSSDGVRGVDDAVCLFVHSPKKAAQHTALFVCDGVHQCVMLCGGWCVMV